VIPCSPSSSTFEGSILVAYDAQTGAPKWQQSITHPITQSSPTVSNGVVYIGTDDGYVLAFDEANGGTLIWNSVVDAGIGPTGPVLSPPVVSRNRVHWVDGNGTLWVVGICFAPGNCY
jgi:outer membrane protein assembly factor BamB